MHTCTASKIHVFYNKSKPYQQLWCDKFVQFTKLFLKELQKIYWILSEHTNLIGIANCLSQLKHCHPSYRKIAYKNKELDFYDTNKLIYIGSSCDSIVSIIMLHADCFPNSKQLDITSTCSTY